MSLTGQQLRAYGREQLKQNDVFARAKCPDSVNLLH